MRVLLLLLASSATACTTMTLRTGIVVVGDRPAVQASIEVGPSVIGRRHGVSASSEWGVQAGETGTHGLAALNLDVIQNDPDEGPLARIGVRMRGVVTDDEREAQGAFLLRGGSYLGLGRDTERRSGGLGVEIAGGLTYAPILEAIFEANLVITGKTTKGTFM